MIKYLFIILGALLNKLLFWYGAAAQNVPEAPSIEAVAYQSSMTQALESNPQSDPIAPHGFDTPVATAQDPKSEAYIKLMEPSKFLGMLPIELWVEILSDLKMKKLNAFSRCSRFANELVANAHAEIAKKRESKLMLLIRSEFLEELSKKASIGQPQESPTE